MKKRVWGAIILFYATMGMMYFLEKSEKGNNSQQNEQYNKDIYPSILVHKPISTTEKEIALLCKQHIERIADIEVTDVAIKDRIKITLNTLQDEELMSIFMQKEIINAHAKKYVFPLNPKRSIEAKSFEDQELHFVKEEMAKLDIKQTKDYYALVFCDTFNLERAHRIVQQV